MNDSLSSVSPCSPHEKQNRSSYLLMDVELSEYLRRVKKMLILKDSGLLSVSPLWPWCRNAHFFALYASNGRLRTRAIQ